MKIAVVGKGGVGKTSISSMLVKVFSEKYKVLAVDADPATGLSMSLGINAVKTLSDVRKRIVKMIKEGYDRVEVAGSIDYGVLDALEERGNIALLAMGKSEEEGCYCQLNTMLRDAIEELSRSFDVTVIDGEAGVEQINRRVMRSVDVLVIVTDESKKGFRVAEEIRIMSSKLVKGRLRGLVVNKTERAYEGIDGYDFIHTVPEDETVFEYDFEGKSFLNLPECEALKAVRKLAAILEKHAGGGI